MERLWGDISRMVAEWRENKEEIPKSRYKGLEQLRRKWALPWLQEPSYGSPPEWHSSGVCRVISLDLEWHWLQFLTMGSCALDSDPFVRSLELPFNVPIFYSPLLFIISLIAKNIDLFLVWGRGTLDRNLSHAYISKKVIGVILLQPLWYLGAP